LSKLYSNLKDPAVKNEIARNLGLPNYTFLENWLIVINLIRNICAHHGRLLDKILPKRILPLKKRSLSENRLQAPRELNKIFFSPVLYKIHPE